jgi:hypothetical protein
MNIFAPALAAWMQVGDIKVRVSVNRLSSMGRKGVATLVEQSQLLSIIATAIRNMTIDYPAIEPGVARESVPFAKAVLKALDKAGLEIVPKKNAAPKPRRREASS